MISGRRILVIAHKEWQEIMRDPIYLLLALLLPVLMMIVFGYGMTQELEDVPFVIVDQDNSHVSRSYGKRFSESRYFTLKGHPATVDAAGQLLRKGKIRFALVIPHNFGQDVTTARQSNVQVLLDGAKTAQIRTIDGYVGSIHAAANARNQIEYLSKHGGLSKEAAMAILQPIKVESRYLYNQELRSIWSVAPSLVMLILTITAPLLMALSIVREKETGTIYNIYASNVGRGEYLVGKLIPNIAVSSFNAFVLIAMATLYFGAPLKGSLLFLAAASVLYVSCISTTGLFVSLVVHTQVAAIIITVVLGFILTQQFSGMMVPISSLTGFNYHFAHAIPPMYFNDLVANTFLKGGGLLMSWREFSMMAIFLAAYFALGYVFFHKRSRI